MLIVKNDYASHFEWFLTSGDILRIMYVSAYANLNPR